MPVSKGSVSRSFASDSWPPADAPTTTAGKDFAKRPPLVYLPPASATPLNRLVGQLAQSTRSFFLLMGPILLSAATASSVLLMVNHIPFSGYFNLPATSRVRPSQPSTSLTVPHWDAGRSKGSCPKG
jgi:hypothetical protein